MASRQGAAVACRTDIFDISRYAVPSALDGRVRRRLLDGCGFGAVGLTGMGLGTSKNSLVSLRKLEARQSSPNLRSSHLPHCTHLCRPETRDGLSTSRLGRSGTAGCRAALGSGESLKLSFEGKRVPARRARSPELGSRGSERWQLRSHAEHEGLGSGWQTDRTVAARGRALETR